MKTALNNPHEEQQGQLLERITLNVTKLNEVVEELNDRLQEINEYNADIKLVSKIWLAYDRNVQYTVDALKESNPEFN